MLPASTAQPIPSEETVQERTFQTIDQCCFSCMNRLPVHVIFGNRRFTITRLTATEHFQFDPSQRLFRWCELFHEHGTIVLHRKTID